MTLTEQEKIQRAEEIYYRRNGINYRTERPQTVREPKSHPIRNFLIIIMIIVFLIGFVAGYFSKGVISENMDNSSGIEKQYSYTDKYIKNIVVENEFM